MTRQRVSGTLGRNPADWFLERGIKASTESDTIRRSQVEMQRRTWHDGSGRRKFEMHLKPNEGTSPDRCVRIYFDFDAGIGRTVVGWIGRHP